MESADWMRMGVEMETPRWKGRANPQDIQSLDLRTTGCSPSPCAESTAIQRCLGAACLHHDYHDAAVYHVKGQCRPHVSTLHITKLPTTSSWSFQTKHKVHGGYVQVQHIHPSLLPTGEQEAGQGQNQKFTERQRIRLFTRFG